ncbi:MULTISPECIES: tetratricopeptide repeat protein [unclassified Bradyrhizobium]|uniref:tetratricopeptide repeat protein n=1 Tax=unclassified Bradyrhizobium TaxID=2631580 RepID=UPI001BA73043|nr:MULTISPECIES: tetratricopeptide repeat protein [unclassified Bradyrhizobium]MBR1229118.1 SEL1-like repeat protein [Bradyrhizobium sp. AUGA SZCCT0176]MBR1300708.1 SEL1-like repeat protein [Bradyrhizobium sp. AUGA SZCCT0042]
MNSRVSWSVEGIDPSVRERAEAAARRAGMSLSDWLNSTIGDSAPPNFRASYDEQPATPSAESREVADIHQRLDSITRQIDQISRPAPRSDAPRTEAPRAEPTVARQLNDAISRLDARLSQISNHAPRQPTMQDRQRQTDLVERAAAQVYRPSPPLSPTSFDSAIAEIAARQNELDGVPSRQMPPRSAPPMAAGMPPMAPSAPAMAYAPPMQPPAPAPAPAPMPAGPDFSSLERHLLKITSQIEAMQRPDNVEQSIAAFRTELADIRRAITEAMPRQAIDSIENEIRSLSRRIDETRQNGMDANVLANLERALGEIYDALRSLKPAEQLAGYDDAIRNLGTKLDLILRTNDDPSTVRQLEDAISAMRAIASNVASNDALARVSDDLHALSAKVDQLSRAGDNSESLASLEQRIAALTSSIETRERPVASDNSEYIEGALRSLSERLDRIPAGNDNASAFTHLEQRVTYLLERLETSGSQGGSGGGNLGRVEEGLQDILRHLEHQHANLARLADNTSSYAAPQSMDSGIVEAVKRELSDIRFNQSETDRRTQDSLETVHSTLGHVVDRLAMIEGDLRAVRAAPPVAAPAPAAYEAREEAPRAMMPPPSFAPPAYVPQAQPQAFAPQPKPELPNPAASQEHFTAAPRDFHAAEPVAPPAIPPMTPRAISEILEPHAAPPRTAIAPELPPDHPLEPGTRPTARASSPSERIAASESVINEISAAAKEPVSSSSFIAAARRAAQAAAAAPANEKAAKAAAKAASKATSKTSAKVTAIDNGKTDGKEPSNITSKIRSLLVGASVFAIVLSTFQLAMTLLDTGSAPQIPQMESTDPAPASKAPAENSAKPAMPAPAGPSMMSPAPIGRQSNNSSAPNTLDGAQVAIPQSTIPQAIIPQAAIPQTAIPPQAAMSIPPQAVMSPINAGDITGALPALPANGKPGMVQVPPGEQLPDGIGGPMLRAAALKGDPTAAYEVGVRFAEGKGVAANLDEAAKWYDRAAQAGVVPAIFRLGTFYEKGMSVKKDADVARRYYLQAAERGNAKAMHNLAVLDADGGGKGANYKVASQWFRKAADRGVADSQFNLGILYARGIGVEQNLAESFKWFSLAAAQGDADSGRKRDDIAKRLDAQSLAAAKLAIQTFTPEPQPDAAVNVATPAGGWDPAPAPAAATKPAAKQASTKRAAASAAAPLASTR